MPFILLVLLMHCAAKGDSSEEERKAEEMKIDAFQASRNAAKNQVTLPDFGLQQEASSW